MTTPEVGVTSPFPTTDDILITTAAIILNSAMKPYIINGHSIPLHMFPPNCSGSDLGILNPRSDRVNSLIYYVLKCVS